LCRRPESFLKDKSGSGYYGESQDGLYDSDGTWDFNEKGIVNEMGPEIASSFENIPQIVLVECNPVFDEERDLHVNKLTRLRTQLRAITLFVITVHNLLHLTNIIIKKNSVQSNISK
jgi:hypothetical protein